MNIKERIKQIAERFHLSEEQVEEVYKQMLEKETREPKEEKALSRTDSYFKSIKARIREEGFFEGFIVSAREPVDIFELRRQKARRLFDNLETRDYAIMEGYTSEDGTPLGFNGQPLKGSLMKRTIYVIAREGNEPFKLQTLTVTGEVQLELPKFFEKVSFRASKISRGLGVTKFTKFFPIEANWSVEEAIRQALPVYRADEIRDYLESTPLEERQFICIEGKVTSISRKSNFVDISTDEMDDYIRCFLRAEADLDFGEDSRVLAIGLPDYGRGNSLVASIYGIYAPFEDRVPPKEW